MLSLLLHLPQGPFFSTAQLILAEHKLFILRAHTNPCTFINAVLLEKKVERTE